MSMTLRPFRSKSAGGRGAKAFGRDRRGVAAVEFALIAPILILIYFALAELCQGMLAERKASHAASAIGDLVSQNSTITPANLTDIFAVANTILRPFPTSATTLQLCVYSATKNAAGTKVLVDWNKTQGSGAPAGFCPAKGAQVVEGAGAGQIPTGLIAANESLVVSKSLYAYTDGLQFDYTLGSHSRLGALKHVNKSTVTFNPVFYLRPRKSDQVVCSTC